jgi:hypothetical protein
VLVHDRVDGARDHALVWRFHLDPAVTAHVEGCDVRLSSGGNTVWLLPDDIAATFSFSVEPGWVSPSYGVKVPTTVLVWKAAVTVPIEASYLFAEAQMNVEERAAVSASLRAGCSGFEQEIRRPGDFVKEPVVS